MRRIFATKCMGSHLLPMRNVAEQIFLHISSVAHDSSCRAWPAAKCRIRAAGSQRPSPFPQRGRHGMPVFRSLSGAKTPAAGSVTRGRVRFSSSFLFHRFPSACGENYAMAMGIEVSGHFASANMATISETTKSFVAFPFECHSMGADSKHRSPNARALQRNCTFCFHLSTLQLCLESTMVELREYRGRVFTVPW